MVGQDTDARTQADSVASALHCRAVLLHAAAALRSKQASSPGSGLSYLSASLPTMLCSFGPHLPERIRIQAGAAAQSLQAPLVLRQLRAAVGPRLRWCISACRSRASRCSSASCHALKPLAVVRVRPNCCAVWFVPMRGRNVGLWTRCAKPVPWAVASSLPRRALPPLSARGPAPPLGRRCRRRGAPSPHVQADQLVSRRWTSRPRNT